MYSEPIIQYKYEYVLYVWIPVPTEQSQFKTEPEFENVSGAQESFTPAYTWQAGT